MPTTVSDTGAVELGLRFTPHDRRLRHRRPLLQGHRQHRHPRRHRCGPPPGQQLASVDLHERDARPAGRPPPSRRRSRSRPARPTSSPTPRPTGATPRDKDAFAASGIDARPAHGRRRVRRPAGRRLRQRRPVPDTTATRTPTTSSTSCFTTIDESPLTADEPVAARGLLERARPAPRSERAVLQAGRPPDSQGLTLKDANGATVPGATAYDATTPDRHLHSAARRSQRLREVHRDAVAGTDDARATSVTTGKTWSFTTAKPDTAAGVCPCTLFDDATVPDRARGRRHRAGHPRHPLHRPTVDGTVTGVRFYKGTEQHRHPHRDAVERRPAPSSPRGPSPTSRPAGWQTLTFATPVQITKNTEYVVVLPDDRRHATRRPRTGSRAPPTSPGHRCGVTATAGTYTYGTGFPTATTSTSYLVDVVFEKAPPHDRCRRRRTRRPAPSTCRDDLASGLVLDADRLERAAT